MLNLNDVIIQMGLKDIFIEYFTQAQKIVFFSTSQETFSKIDYIYDIF